MSQTPLLSKGGVKRSRREEQTGERTQTGERPQTGGRLFLGLLLALLAVLLCLVPKPENDLFFELRIGTDILRTGHLPHADLYSWTRRGTPWDVPEWGAFVLYALAFRAGGFWGTWLLMTALTLAATAILWGLLLRHRVSPPAAWAVTALTLLAASPCLQERPYAFTYPLLAAALALLAWARARGLGPGGHPHALWALWALIPLCALWTNLHQGVLAFVCLLLACAAGDALTAVRRRRQAAQDPPDLLTETGRAQADRTHADPDGPRAHAAQARRMAAAAAACAAAAAACSPYGWGVYRTVFVTLGDRQLMANVTEWNPITVLPPSQLPPFVLLAVLAFAALALKIRPDSQPPLTASESPRSEPSHSEPSDSESAQADFVPPLPRLQSPASPPPPLPRRSLADGLMLAGLGIQAALHARNTALFAVGAAAIIAPRLAPAGAEITRRLRLPRPTGPRHTLFAVGAALCVVAAAAVACLLGLQRAAGPRGLSSPAGIGEAVARVPAYPAAACAFMDAEGFPSHLRLLNSFEDGGYLLWRLPREPVFIDGRLDVYTGQTFADTLTLSREPASPAAAALRARYDLDCVLTTSPRQAAALRAAPDWEIVYADPPGPSPSAPRARIFLRRRPQFAALIARCLHTPYPLGTTRSPTVAGTPPRYARCRGSASRDGEGPGERPPKHDTRRKARMFAIGPGRVNPAQSKGRKDQKEQNTPRAPNEETRSWLTIT